MDSLLAGLRGVYDSVFFYGLDPPKPRKASDGESQSRAGLRTASGNNLKKSPFFTPSEQWAVEFVEATAPGSDASLGESGDNWLALDQEGKSKKIRPKSGGGGRGGSSERQRQERVRELEFLASDLREDREILNVTLAAGAGLSYARKVALEDELGVLQERIDAIHVELVDLLLME